MRDFAKIAPQLWTGSTGRAIRRLGRDCQVVAFYLMTCPTANALGLYYLPIATLSYETGISAQGALKALQSLSQVGFSAYDAPSEWVFVFNMARFQIGERLEAKDNRVKWIKRSLETLRKAPFFNEFLNRYRDAFQLDDISPSEAPSEDHRSSETETEKEKQQSGSRPISKPRKPEIPLPDDWKLTPELRRYAAEHGRDPDLEAERLLARSEMSQSR